MFKKIKEMEQLDIMNGFNGSLGGKKAIGIKVVIEVVDSILIWTVG